MSAAGKSSRRYESPRRREQAAATRELILDAANSLFERDGYAATSMVAIADRAGVSLKTVYLGFETKSGLLRAVWHRVLRGDRDDLPVGEQTLVPQVLDAPDPERQLRLNAHNSRAVKERAGAIMEVIHAAAPGDPEIGRAVGTDPVRVSRKPARRDREPRGQRRADTGPRHRLRGRHPVDAQPPHGLPPARGRPRWTPERYGQWLGDILCSQFWQSSRQLTVSRVRPRSRRPPHRRSRAARQAALRRAGDDAQPGTGNCVADRDRVRDRDHVVVSDHHHRGAADLDHFSGCHVDRPTSPVSAPTRPGDDPARPGDRRS